MDSQVFLKMQCCCADSPCTGPWIRARILQQVCSEAKAEGLSVSKIAPGLYYLIGSDGLPAIVLATHVDDLLWCATPEGSDTMERILAKFDGGKIEDTDFRFFRTQIQAGSRIQCAHRCGGQREADSKDRHPGES